MELADELQRKITRKQQEIADLEGKLRDAKTYLQALMDVARHLPRQAQDGGELTIRTGSQVAQARDLIRKAGKPLHVKDLLRAMGRPLDKNARAGLSGSLSAYVRKGEVFTRTAPNTFGLVELGEGEVPPPSFGIDNGVAEHE